MMMRRRMMMLLLLLLYTHPSLGPNNCRRQIKLWQTVAKLFCQKLDIFHYIYTLLTIRRLCYLLYGAIYLRILLAWTAGGGYILKTLYKGQISRYYYRVTYCSHMVWGTLYKYLEFSVIVTFELKSEPLSLRTKATTSVISNTYLHTIFKCLRYLVFFWRLYSYIGEGIYCDAQTQVHDACCDLCGRLRGGVRNRPTGGKTSRGSFVLQSCI